MTGENSQGPDPRIADALKQASGTIPITPGERLRIEFVVTAAGDVKLSLPGPQLEAEVWKFMAYAPEFIKTFYQKKRSPLSI
jgi:hypothetical protein